MSRCKQLRQEAAQVRGRIDRRAWLVRQRLDSLMHGVRALARTPAALPLAFACGILVARLHVPGIKRAYRFLAGQMKAMQIASSLIGSPVCCDPLTSPVAPPQRYQRETGHGQASC